MRPARVSILALLLTTMFAPARAGQDAARSGVAAAPVIAQVDSGELRLEFDRRLFSRLLVRGNTTGAGSDAGAPELPLGDFQPSELVVIGGREVVDFVSDAGAGKPGAPGAVTRAGVKDSFGSGVRWQLQGTGADLRKQLAVTSYEEFPGLLLIEVSYSNIGPRDLRIERWVNRRFVAARAGAGSAASSPPFWSYQPGSYENRPDWIRPVKPGFRQRNYLGMNATDYGGGTPVADVWRRDVGVAIGHLELAPKLVALPVTMPDRSGAQLAIEEQVDRVLRPGESLATLRTFVSVHRGDHWASLVQYRRLMQRQGVAFASFGDAAYEPIWCGWGYDRAVTGAQMRGTFAKAVELGFKWAVLDDGWQTGVGDWSPQAAKFPGGDADMKALTGAMGAAGLRAMLWWAPLAAHPKSALAQSHPDYLLLGQDGKPQKISWWDSHLLCPAYAPVQNYTRGLVSQFVRDWGYAGLKLDGQHLNAAPPCYNPAHRHADPREAVEAMPQFFKLIRDTALASQPAAVIELCPCGTSYNFHALPYTNLPAASDPESSWQVRSKGKTLKALMGPSAPYFGDHVELSDGGDDFASTVGVGGVVGSQFTLPALGKSKLRWHLTPRKEPLWRKWVALYTSKDLARGETLGQLYDLGFDRPEAHVIRQNGRLHYAFFAKRFAGHIELRGLEARDYLVRDYVADRSYGTVRGPTARLPVRFRQHLLLEAIPQ